MQEIMQIKIQGSESKDHVSSLVSIKEKKKNDAAMLKLARGRPYYEQIKDAIQVHREILTAR